MRSAKMKLTTPPKLIPPFHRAAASGTLPIEQTKLTMAISGPTIAFSTDVAKPCPWKKMVFQTLFGTRTARKPATRYQAICLETQRGRSPKTLAGLLDQRRPEKEPGHQGQQPDHDDSPDILTEREL